MAEPIGSMVLATMVLNILAALGGIAAMCGLYFLWADRRDRAKQTLPYVASIEIYDDDKIADWLEFHIQFINPGDINWSIDHVKLNCRHVEGVERDRIKFHDLYGGPLTTPEAISASSSPSPIPVHGLLSGAATRGRFYLVLFLRKSSIRKSKLSMRFILVSQDAVQRRCVIDAKRQLTAQHMITNPSNN